MLNRATWTWRLARIVRNRCPKGRLRVRAGFRADSLLISESLQKEIDRSLNTLTEREREVIKLFFGIGMNHGLTLEEIGAKFDLTRERVRQIKEKAIRRLRHKSRSKLLKAYLG